MGLIMQSGYEDVELKALSDTQLHSVYPNVMWTASNLKRVVRHVFKPYVIAEVHYVLLVFLRQTKKAYTQNELSELLVLDKSSITGIVDKLERLDYLARLRVHGDRRKYHLAITEAGKVAIKEYETMFVENLSPMLEGISREDVDVYVKVAKKMRENLRTKFPEVDFF